MKEKNKKALLLLGKVVGTLVLLGGSNYYLQLCQNNFSWDLATKFAFQWHTQKFFLGCLVLGVFLLFISSLIGSWGVGLLFYTTTIGILGFADYQKMHYRMEPIYPDDLKMITELGLLKEMVGTIPFVVCLLLIGVTVGVVLYAMYRSIFLPKKKQLVRVTLLVISLAGLIYVSDFNNPKNVVRKAYNKTALWIPYSQKMNYYNTGFVGGFLYNLRVVPMEKPKDYSEKRIQKIVAHYQKKAKEDQVNTTEERPNIVYIMSESFSDPLRLKGLKTSADPLEKYREIADDTYSGQMLSQNYGGGTANIEFEALTSFSMEPFNGQLTTPYTMLLPKMKHFPSIVSQLQAVDYKATAIHPYNTSMYKRKNVYKTLGFDEFLDEDTMKYDDKISDNPYISDAAAFHEVLDVLEEGKQSQFIHLVTMQTHMPYKDKYPPSKHTIEGVSNPKTLDNYMQDISYTSKALVDFCQALEALPERTLVVFWGDHLPSIYSDSFQKKNTKADLHLTEFFVYDSTDKLDLSKTSGAITSPFYFAPTLFQAAHLQQPGFYQLVNQLQTALPAFEQNLYLKKGVWHEKNPLKKSEKNVYEDYRLIQYDVVAGKQYSVKADFFKE